MSAAFLLLLVSSAGAAAATDSSTRGTSASSRAEARARNQEIDNLVKRAIELRRQGKDREALTELRHAAEIERQPRVAAQIGMAEQALGLWAPAERDLKEALASGSDPWIAQHKGTLDEALQFIKSHLADLDVWGPPDGAEMYVDGELIGVFPLQGPVRVPVGKLELMVKAPAYTPARRELDVQAGASLREHLILRALALDLPPPRMGEAAPVAAPAAAVVAVDTEETTTSSSLWTRWWLWAAVGVIAVGAGVGVYALLRPHDTCSDSMTRTCSTFTP